eukprot:763932-Hanusia_phi.AAC.5
MAPTLQDGMVKILELMGVMLEERSFVYHSERSEIESRIQCVLKLLATNFLNRRRIASLGTQMPLQQRSEHMTWFRFRACLALMLLKNDLRLLSLTSKRPLSHGEIKSPEDFTDTAFLELFGFTKEHFYQLLGALKDSKGRPMMVRGVISVFQFGKKRHMNRVSADKGLMIFLRRSAVPCRWSDLQEVIGGSRTFLSDTFAYMTDMLYDRYSPLICDLNCWKQDFDKFARYIHSKGCPQQDTVMMLERHFQETDLQGGQRHAAADGSDLLALCTASRQPGLNYYAGVFPNGTAMLWGPWMNPADGMATDLRAQVCDKFSNIKEETGVNYCAYVGRTHPAGACYRHYDEAQTVYDQDQSDSLLSSLRLFLQGTLEEAVRVWTMVNDRCNHRLGQQKLEKMFTLQLLFFNIRTILSRSQVVEQQEGQDSFIKVSVEEYLSKVEVQASCQALDFKMKLALNPWEIAIGHWRPESGRAAARPAAGRRSVTQ